MHKVYEVMRPGTGYGRLGIGQENIELGTSDGVKPAWMKPAATCVYNTCPGPQAGGGQLHIDGRGYGESCGGQEKEHIQSAVPGA